jgi:hypothetical protein
MIMRRLLLMLAVFSLLAWAPDAFDTRDWSESQLLTRNTPTLATEGIDLTRMISFTVAIQPGSMMAGVCHVSSTATFSGGGQIDLYFRDATAGWYVGDPSTFWLMTGCSGRKTCSKTFDVLSPRGRALAATNAVTISAGNCLLVRILGSISGKSSTL